MHPTAQRVEFRFNFVVNGVSTRVIRTTRGIVGAEKLLLGDTVLRFSEIGETVSRGNRLMLEVLTPELAGKAARHVQDSVLVLECKGIRADRLEALIDQRVAASRLAGARERAKEEGVEHLVRTERCPTCEAEVDLTGIDEGKYVYCPYCDTIWDRLARSSLGRDYRTCDECGWFGRVKEYPEFYFYFLIFVYSFSYGQRFLCTSCAHALFVRALWRNLIFVIGVPVAIWVKIKSLVGGDEAMAELHRANQLARKGDLREAIPIYERLRQRFPDHPGLLLNEGLSCLARGHQSAGTERLERALVACPNYMPLVRMLDEG